MTNFRIGVFAYNFKHWKTQNGIINLFANGFKPVVVFAADATELTFYRSKINISPIGFYLTEPKVVCEKLDIPYEVIQHNSSTCAELIKKNNLDIGIILGARILKGFIIDSFKIGVLNLHPGILPDNRGLDNIKWSIIKKMPIGVTSHFINEKIDMGRLIECRFTKVYKYDSISDVSFRNMNLEQEMMIDAMRCLRDIEIQIHSLPRLGEGVYHKSVPENIESSLFKYFVLYKQEFCF